MTTCLQLGPQFAGDQQVEGEGMNGGPTTDGPITFTVRSNTPPGTYGPGGNTAAVVDITVAAGTTVTAVVVKGGDGYNLYLPPNVPPGETLAFRSPLNDGGNLPQISHWFICYQFTEPPPTPGTGSISLSKSVILPGGVIVTPPPSSYTASVDCGTAGSANVTLPGDGGPGTPNPALTGLTGGTSCTVTETTTLPPYVSVSYSPSSTVSITDGTDTEVTITNDFSNAPVEMGTLQVEKVVTNPNGASTPANWTAQVSCDNSDSPATTGDSDMVTTVTMPGTGGPGTPVVHPDIGAGCTVQELNAPTGWTVTYSVNGGAATSTPPSINISGTATVTVTITNHAPAPTPTPSASPSAPPPGLPSTGEPPSGGPPLLAIVIACLIAAMGGGVTVLSRR